MTILQKVGRDGGAEGDTKRVAVHYIVVLTSRRSIYRTNLNLFGGLSSGVNGKNSSCMVIRMETKSVEILLHSIRTCGSLVYEDDECVCVCVFTCRGWVYMCGYVWRRHISTCAYCNNVLVN